MTPTRNDDDLLDRFSEGWIDVSRPLRPGTPVWPGDRPFEIEQRREDGLVMGSFCTTCHIGTHLDAPLHLDPTASAVDGVPLERCVGPAEVVRVAPSAGVVTLRDLPNAYRPSVPRVLVRTDSYPVDAAIDQGWAGLSPDLVHWLADRGVELVGVDTPSVDVLSSHDLPSHYALLERGMTWIEGLWLSEVEPGPCLLFAPPILLEGADAAPVRAIVKPITTEV